jgi:large subunit ribosomal protein L13
MNELIINAKDGVLGRIASHAAKQSLLGKTITITNCNEAIITGRKQDIILKYKTLIAKGGSSQKGPKILKTPERIMKRTIRGMLSHKQSRGSEAHKRIICYNETPSEFEGRDSLSMIKDLKTNAITLKELSKLL